MTTTGDQYVWLWLLVPWAVFYTLFPAQQRVRQVLLIRHVTRLST